MAAAVSNGSKSHNGTLIFVYFVYFVVCNLLAIVGCTLFGAGVAAGDTVKRPGMEFSRLELFLDDELISYTHNVRREVVQPTKHPQSPILRRDYPWESAYNCAYGRVMFDEQRDVFRMWYSAYGSRYVTGQKYRDEQTMCYAESGDGVHWKKPLLDINPLPGHDRTNIVMGTKAGNVHGPCVIINPDQSDPERRFLVLFDSYAKWHKKEAAQFGFRGRACYVAASPDGLHWSPPGGQYAFVGKADSGQSVVWEPRTRTFRAYTRLTTKDAFGQRIRTWKMNESKDFLHWTEPMELFRTDERDGYPDMQLQQLAISRYEGTYIGLLSLFLIKQYVELEGGAIEEGAQRNNIQLVTSRDGIHFTRVADRALFIPHAKPGEFGTNGYRTFQLLRHKDKVFIYCDGRNIDPDIPLGVHFDRNRLPGADIGLFTLPRDRFVALVPRRVREEALVELVPMQYPDGRLLLNAATVKSGAIEVEVATFDGFSVVEGFARTDSVKIAGDSLQHEVLWQRDGKTYSLDALPGELQGKAVRLRFWIRQGRIFALASSQP